MRIVAIDGGAASGKSGLARRLAATLDDVDVVHTDDLLDGWPGQFDFWTRLRAGVLDPLRRGQDGSYRRYDWSTGRFGEAVPVPRCGTLIVEGVSAIEACRGYADVTIFLDVARDERERRWAARDGAPLQPQWRRWLDAEDVFFAAHPPDADFVLDEQSQPTIAASVLLEPR